MAECTIYDKLRYIAETKDLIKAAIETQDVEVLESDTFRQYAEYITEIRKVSSVNGQVGDVTLKTVNGQDLVGEGNIIIEGGSEYSAGDGISIVDNTITNTGVTAINLGENIDESFQRKGIVKLYTQWYDNSYEIALNGTSVFGVKPIDDTIVLENAGQSANGNFRCGIKVNTDNFKTINGESLVGSGDITVPTKTSELTNDSGFITLDDVVIPDVDLNGYATETWVLEQIPSMYVKKVYRQNNSMTVVDQDGNADTYNFATINGQSIFGNSGDITIEGGSDVDLSDYYNKSEVDTITNSLVTNIAVMGGDRIAVIQKNGNIPQEIYFPTINGQQILGVEGDITISGGDGSSSGSETDPIFTAWKDRNYVTLGNGATDSGEANGIVIGYNATGSNNTISIGQYANAYMNSIAIGKQATTNSDSDIAIGNETGGVQTDSTYKINIGNTFKGDRNNYAYILNADGNYVKIIDTYYTKTEIDSLIGGVTDKISEINEMI